MRLKIHDAVALDGRGPALHGAPWCQAGLLLGGPGPWASAAGCKPRGGRENQPEAIPHWVSRTRGGMQFPDAIGWQIPRFWGPKEA